MGYNRTKRLEQAEFIEQHVGRRTSTSCVYKMEMASGGNEREKIEMVWICREMDRKMGEIRANGGQGTGTRTVGINAKEEAEGGN